MSVKGYKVFNSDWTCRGFQYAVGEIFKHDGDIEMCGAGFHFCTRIADCFNYHPFDSSNKVAEIEAIGDVITGDDKSVTNEIKIIREISWHEVLELANTGKDCTGCNNSGNFNSGYRNSGNYNSGNYNSGDWNSGYCNSGNYNSGNYNSGDRNSGNYNSGDRNSGNYNSGDCNSGNFNSDDYNSGYCNSGSYNSGDRNSGDFNSGDCNSGNFNSGDCNSGDFNSGDCNSGDWNSCNFSTGFFNSVSQPLYAFNKPINMERGKFYNCEGVQILYNEFSPTQWIGDTDMTDKEKEEHPDYKTTGGYLKTFDFKTACERMWEQLTEKEKKEVCRIPNFDADVFKKITGIDVGGV